VRSADDKGIGIKGWLSGRRLAAIMFTDIVGYTALTEKNEPLTLELLEEHRKLLRPLFQKHNGKEIKTWGDAFLVEFVSALEAVKCAIQIQEALSRRNLECSEEKRIGLRIGIHVGDVEHRRGDVYGDAVNIASRIEPLAEASGIVITRQVYDQIHHSSEFKTQSLGSRELKNVKEPVEIFSISSVEGVRPAPLTISKTRVAVLPFANISPDPTDEYFASGMTEELISTLSSIKGLSIISRTSVMPYKNTTKRAAEIARELNSRVLLEGSVRKSGNKLRITTQLIDAVEDKHLWAEKYDRVLEDVFAVQAEIAQKVAQSLKAELLPDSKERIEKGSTTSAEAHTRYLKARHDMSTGTTEGMLAAMEYLRVAIEEDQNYALAYAGLAECYLFLLGIIFPDKDGISKAKMYARKAIETDDNLAEAHTSIGIIAMQYDWDWQKAELEFKRAIELNPSYSVAHMYYGILLTVLGRTDSGISELKLAEQLDPASPLIKTVYGALFLFLRKYGEAMAKCKESVALYPSGNELAHVFLGIVYFEKSLPDEAIMELKKAIELNKFSHALGYLGYVYAATGRREEALATIANLMRENWRGLSFETDIATVYIGLGETNKALEFLEKALEARDPWLVFSAGPFFDPVRSNPRYLEIMRKVGLPIEQAQREAARGPRR
jgi:adenylate cyclase